MSVPKINRKDLPENTFVVRIKGTNRYIHVTDDSYLMIKPVFVGCYVFRSKESADDVIEVLNDLESGFTDNVTDITDFESIHFQEAYNERGILEKQMFYN